MGEMKLNEKTKDEVPQEQVHYLVFSLAEKNLALPLNKVERVVHAASVTQLPKAPEIVRGLINYKGQILPVIDIAKRFHLNEQPLKPEHHFIIVDSKTRRFALVAHSLTGVMNVNANSIVPPVNIIEDVEFIEAVMKLKSGMMLIPDMDKVLTGEESKALSDAVMKKKKDAK
jgi:purine-binding chemotaxis protein CheW